MKNEKGQSLIFALVTTPLLLLLSGIIVRSGMTAFIHSRTQKFLDHRALSALKEQALGLENLGKINKEAQALIEARRKVDLAIKAALGTPAVLPLLKTRLQLMSGQKAVATAQNKIKTQTLFRTLQILNGRVPDFFSKKMKIDYFPKNPKELLLHVKDQKPYLGEVGAPQELTQDFVTKQKINLSAVVRTEKFLHRWPQFSPLPPMKVFSASKLHLKKLEDPWVVILDKARGNLSWN